MSQIILVSIELLNFLSFYWIEQFVYYNYFFATEFFLKTNVNCKCTLKIKTSTNTR